jgi:hypothetical protein
MCGSISSRCFPTLAQGLFSKLPVAWTRRRRFGQYVFDSVFINGDTFLPPIIFQPSQPIAAAPKIVEVASLYIPPEFIVGWKPSV